jgi:hypothetical protein
MVGAIPPSTIGSMRRSISLLLLGATACPAGSSTPEESTSTATDADTGSGGSSSPATSTWHGEPPTSGEESDVTGPGDDAGSDTSTGDPVAPPTCGVLEGIPSEPGPHVAQIEALGEGEWLPLGPPAADPEHGVGFGRSWGGRAFALAPDLRGAFFTGEGVHAYVKPDGFAMDDVFFYDIHAHAWIAIHPGNEIATFNQRVADGDLSIDDNGQLEDEHGNPVPLHVLIHAWDFVTYDTASQRFAFIAGDGMGDYYMPGLETIQPGLDELYAQREGIEIPPMSPWFWSTADCVWEREPVATPAPDVGGFAAFVYASATDRYVYAGANGVATYDLATGAWTTVADTGPRPTGYDHGVAYDSMRDRLYMGSGDGTTAPGVFIYDIATATWTKPESSGPAPATFRTNEASIFYDSVSDLVTVFHYGERTQYTYDPAADTWTSQPIPDEVLDSIGGASFNAFYDPVLDAYFVYAAGDSSPDGAMWAHR